MFVLQKEIFPHQQFLKRRILSCLQQTVADFPTEKQQELLQLYMLFLKLESNQSNLTETINIRKLETFLRIQINQQFRISADCGEYEHK